MQPSPKLNCQLRVTPTDFSRIESLTVSFHSNQSGTVTLLPARVKLNVNEGENHLSFKIKRLILCDLVLNDITIQEHKLAPSFFAGEAFSLECSGEKHLLSVPSLKIVRLDGTIVENDGVGVFVSDNTMVKGVSRDLCVYNEQVNARILVKKASQLSVYLLEDPKIDEKKSPACTSLTLFHDDEGNCSVFKDFAQKGQWVADQRIKLGCFKFYPDHAYDLVISCDDTVIGVMINNNDGTPENRTLQNFVIDIENRKPLKRVLIKESYKQGHYEIQDLLGDALKAMEEQNVITES